MVIKSTYRRLFSFPKLKKKSAVVCTSPANKQNDPSFFTRLSKAFLTLAGQCSFVPVFYLDFITMGCVENLCGCRNSRL